MKKSLLIMSGIISITSLMLCGCAGDGTDYATVIDANFTRTLPVVTVTRTTIDSEALIVDEEALLAKVKGTNDGVIDIDGAGRFYYGKFTDGVVLQGVTVIDYYALRVADGPPFTGPINYWVEFNFTDGSKKYLSNVGLLFDEV
jgi:TM2 domain-containing membrane protein YozV